MARLAAIATDLKKSGHDLTHIWGSHGLRASGVMALQLNGYDREMIHQTQMMECTKTYRRYVLTLT